MMQESAQTALKIPWSVAGPAILMFLGQLFLVFRELLKFKDFSKKNGLLGEIKEKVNGIDRKVEGMQSNCQAVSTALTKQTDSNSQEILELWKARAKQKDE